LWLAEGKGEKMPDGIAPVLQHEIPPKILRLDERLASLPDDKLNALSVLLGMKL
jgi:hypothetical protein